MKRILLILAALSLFSLTLAGCGGDPAPAPAKQEQKAEGSLKVITSFYPMYIAAANITDGVPGVELTNLTPPQTGCLHDYQLTTADMKSLEKGNVFIINGAGMESFLDKVTGQQKDLKIINASKDIPLLKDEDEENPHVWLSVTHAITQVKNITSQLSAIDPKNKAAYEKNAAAYIKKLEDLKKDMHGAIDALPNKDIVTFHEAFPYFAQEFNLHIAAVIEREPGSEPTPTELKETIEKVNALPVKVLFTEPQYSPGAAEAIARETGAKIFSLDPVVTGEANDSAKNAYIEVMKKNQKTLQEALQ